MWARLLGLATHDLAWPLVGGALAASIVGAGLLVHEWTVSLRAEGAATATAQCVAQAEAASAAAVKRLEAHAAAQADAARTAQAQVTEATRRAAAAHRALEAERAAHAKTREDACAAGCSVHLPPS